MEVVCTLGQALILLLVIALFVAGLVMVGASLAGANNSPQEIARRANTQIEQSASEGHRAMDDLTEQYLDELFSQVTDRPHQR